MPQHRFFERGTYNFVCDQCGRVFRSTDMRTRWDGAVVCSESTCWEPRHPQDMLRPVIERPGAPWARPWVPNFVVTSVARSGALGTPLLGSTALGGP